MHRYRCGLPAVRCSAQGLPQQVQHQLALQQAREPSAREPPQEDIDDEGRVSEVPSTPRRGSSLLGAVSAANHAVEAICGINRSVGYRPLGSLPGGAACAAPDPPSSSRTAPSRVGLGPLSSLARRLGPAVEPSRHRIRSPSTPRGVPELAFLHQADDPPPDLRQESASSGHASSLSIQGVCGKLEAVCLATQTEVLP